MKLHLFHLPGSCSRVTLTALEMTEAPFEVSVPSVHRGGLKDPEFRRVNPLGQVPILLVDGGAITENVAILTTLARLFPAAGILPAGTPLEEAHNLSRLGVCSSQLHPCVTRIMFPQNFCDAGQDAIDRVRAMAKEMLLTRLSTQEPILARQPWWLGETFSIADVYLRWVTGRMIRLGLDFSNLPALTAHADRVRDQPIMQRVLAREAGFVAALEADGAVFPAHVRPSMTA